MTGIDWYAGLGLAPLPVDAILDDLCTRLEARNSAVLVAAPGAGKTSRAPLALLQASWNEGKKLIILEPRRLAARAGAEHMAGLLGERVGKTVGYRVRMDSKTGASTRIEFVTEGVFTRMTLDDPQLSGVGAVLFDEYHERSLEADLGLALALDVQNSLREDLRIIPMSATLDGAAVSALLDDCPVIESEGRSFPVDIRYRPGRPDTRVEDEMAAAIETALAAETGDILCFLPGQGEIRRTAERLRDLPENVHLHQLYGAMKPEDQRAAISPAPAGRRKVVLATSIAQTSLTLEGVRVVIDSGLARVPRHEPSTGLTRLETVRASRATVTQRSGRAGRTEPGAAIRLWHEGQTASLPDHDRPEILEAELSSLVLDLAAWGVSDPASLKWLDQPPKPAWGEAVKLLTGLGALNESGLITASGKVLRDMPLPPKLAHMVVCAAPLGGAEDAARLALLVSERGAGGNSVDLADRLERLASASDPRSRKLKATARSIASSLKTGPQLPDWKGSAGALLSIAWPERIAKRVGNGANGEAQYLLVNGRRALLDGLLALAREDWIAITDLQGSAAAGRITGAAALNEDEVPELHRNRIQTVREVTLDEKSGRFQAWESRKLGAIALGRVRVMLSGDEDIAELLLDYLRGGALAKHLAGEKSAAFVKRLQFLHHHFPGRFASGDAAELEQGIDEWLGPMIAGVSGPGELSDVKMLEALKHYAGYGNLDMIDRLAPARWTLPTGNTHLIHYEGESATLSARVQEFFGMNEHPAIAGGSVPLILELLSPAMRPLQKTLDIGGFWEGSWQDVRKEMRGRYPKHVWPDDPANAAPTSRAKPRGKQLD